jgi:hypothetical protein
MLLKRAPRYKNGFGMKRTKYTDLKSQITTQIEEIKKAGTYKNERVITTAQNAEISVQVSKKPVLNFCGMIIIKF